MSDWLIKLVAFLAFLAVALLVLRYVLTRMVRMLGRGGQVTLAALSSGGLSLFSGALDADLEPAPETKPKTKRALVLNALATGGISLFYTDPPAGQGDSGAGGSPMPLSGSSGEASAPPERLA